MYLFFLGWSALIRRSSHTRPFTSIPSIVRCSGEDTIEFLRFTAFTGTAGSLCLGATALIATLDEDREAQAEGSQPAALCVDGDGHRRSTVIAPTTGKTALPRRHQGQGSIAINTRDNCNPPTCGRAIEASIGDPRPWHMDRHLRCPLIVEIGSHLGRRTAHHRVGGIATGTGIACVAQRADSAAKAASWGWQRRRWGRTATRRGRRIHLPRRVDIGLRVGPHIFIGVGSRQVALYGVGGEEDTCGRVVVARAVVVQPGEIVIVLTGEAFAGGHA